MYYSKSAWICTHSLVRFDGVVIGLLKITLKGEGYEKRSPGRAWRPLLNAGLLAAQVPPTSDGLCPLGNPHAFVYIFYVRFYRV
jgi:hypothetical protein